MHMSIFGFFFGVLLVQRSESLPPLAGWIAGTIVLVLMMAVLARMGSRIDIRVRSAGMRASLFALALVAGGSWTAWRAELRLSSFLPMAWELVDVEVRGVVHGLPQASEHAVRFVLEVERSDAPVPRRIQLSWYAPRARFEAGGGVSRAELPRVLPGERWTLTVRLRRPHGFANPHGFDYEGWLFERGIRATGYVREHPGNRLETGFVATPMNAIHRARAGLRERFLETLPDAEYAGILVALAIGDQRAIPVEQWEVFRNTAVAHLVSISGLHVSLVALMCGGALAWFWRGVPWLVLRLPSRKAGACAGLLAAACYAVLAGLGLPTQRALIMLAVAALAMLLDRDTRPGAVMSLALLAVLVADPWAVLSAGFWLSFGAVAVIVFVVSGRLRPVGGWRAAVRVQLAITLATAPLLLLLFNGFSVVAPFANALAIPLVSFVIAPLSLASILLPVPQLLEVAHGVTAFKMRYLEWLAASPQAMFRGPAAPFSLTLCALLAVVWILLPRGVPARHMAWLAMLPLLLWQPPRPQEGTFRAVVLDVGQGLAVHVQTRRHDLIYDTGPPYGPDADAGTRVIVPYLVAAGVSRLDKVVISHGDADHVGGAASLMGALSVARFMHAPSEYHPDLSRRASLTRQCVAGKRWWWDGVLFEVLHPRRDQPPYAKANDNSCVIRIVAAGVGAMLLTGDIELPAERDLVNSNRDRLAADVVQAPHHGSRSSSSPALVHATGARHVIHAVGNLNRFRHPHPEVWARWSASGARNWRSDGQGAIVVRVDRDGVDVIAERGRRLRYWHGR